MAVRSLMQKNNPLIKNSVRLSIKNKNCHTLVRNFAVSRAIRQARQYNAARARERYRINELKRQLAELNNNRPKVPGVSYGVGGENIQGGLQENHPHTTARANGASQEKSVFTDTGTTPAPLQDYNKYKARSSSSTEKSAHGVIKDENSPVTGSKTHETSGTHVPESTPHAASGLETGKDGTRKTKPDTDIPPKKSAPTTSAESLPKTENVEKSTDMPVESGMKNAIKNTTVDQNAEILKAQLSTADAV